MVDRQPSFLVLQLCLVLVSVIITVRNSKLAGAYGKHAKRKLQYQADSSGFINIDCGASKSYRDKVTGLVYESDTKYIDTGETHEINPDFTSDTYHRQQRYNLRSFPQGKRNCYTLKPSQAGKNNYLIRAVFEYGNYDDNNMIPVFDLYLGVNKWARMSPERTMVEIIHKSSVAYIDVCLVNIGQGVPYISALELRPLDDSLYLIKNGALRNIYSYDIGGENDIRYPEDVFDRYWFPDTDHGNWSVLTSNESTIQSSDDRGNYKVPDQLLKTAAASKNASVSLRLDFEMDDGNASVSYIFFHFAEIENLAYGSIRKLKIEVNGASDLSEPVNLDEYLKPMTINSTDLPISGEKPYFRIYAAEESDLPPILNAVEVFSFIALPDSPTNFKEAQGYKEFHSEVKLLMRVHHRNLTSLVGYCIEGTHMGIIYEYMTNGSLDQYFSGKHEGKNASILSWEDRMRIAVDAAQGLEYLHDGSQELLAPLGTLILSIIHQTG
ncbi:hypothetical protein Q3G72_022015 [Acer saccharum]|nr:hypothetical protein Q3G72_022015 [Acer saccharum]